MHTQKDVPTLTSNKITTKQLTISAALIGINLVFNQFTISFGPLLEVGFAFLPIAMLGYLYGPIYTGIASGIADVIGFIMRPAGFFFPGFTLNAILLGVIYGLFLHKKQVTLMRVVLAVLCITVFIHLILTPIWLNIMYESPFFAAPRIVKSILLYPVEVGLLYTLLKNYERITKKK